MESRRFMTYRAKRLARAKDWFGSSPRYCVFLVLRAPTVAACEPGVIDPDLRLGSMASACLLSRDSEVAYIGEDLRRVAMVTSFVGHARSRRASPISRQGRSAAGDSRGADRCNLRLAGTSGRATKRHRARRGAKGRVGSAPSVRTGLYRSGCPLVGVRVGEAIPVGELSRDPESLSRGGDDAAIREPNYALRPVLADLVEIVKVGRVGRVCWFS
jgi:hypothetical protein